MIRRALLGLVGAAALGCSSSSSGPSGVFVVQGADGGARDAGGGADASFDSSVEDTGTTDASEDGASDGDDAADTGGGGPPPPAAVCSRTATWGTGTLLSISTPSSDELGAVTADELSIAWTIGTGGAAVIAYADRASTSAPFGSAQTVPAGAFAADRVALSQDGLRMVVVNADGQGFSELTRAARSGSGSTFGAPAIGTYSNLDAAGALASGQAYGDPVLSADDRSFYYSIYGGGSTATIFRTARLFQGDAWPAGGAVMATSDLEAQGSQRRRPTGISSDEQTIFVWDEIMGIERAAWIDETTGAFDQFVNLGAMSMAAPNAACTTLYFSSQGASSIDLYSATD